MSLKPLNSNYRPNVGSLKTVTHRRRWYRTNTTLRGNFAPSSNPRTIRSPRFVRPFRTGR